MSNFKVGDKVTIEATVQSISDFEGKVSGLTLHYGPMNLYLGYVNKDQFELIKLVKDETETVKSNLNSIRELFGQDMKLIEFK